MSKAFLKFLLISIIIILINTSLSLAEDKEDFKNILTNESAFGPIIKGENYEISRSLIHRKIAYETFFDDIIIIKNLGDEPLKVSFSVEGDVSSFITLSSDGITVPPKNESVFSFTIFGRKIGFYEGALKFSGDIEKIIPINLFVTEDLLTSIFYVEVLPLKNKFYKDTLLEFNVDIHELIAGDYNITLVYFLESLEGDFFKFLGRENLTLSGSVSLLKEIELTEDIVPGDYNLQVQISYLDVVITSSAIVSIGLQFYKYKLFGVIPVWIVMIVFFFLFAGLFAFYYIRKKIEERKKYHIKVDFKTLEKKGPEALFLGKVAETNFDFYLNINQLTTHLIDAGATGGGKSISAQVIVEEALMKGVAVIVFDPTAQWSGMLRKCKDKKMMSFYPKFNLKPQDARAFNGNVRQINDAREVIDIKKYAKPGEIQIFSVNKLDPQDIDIFVANTIISVFHANFPESPTLKLLIVYDEVHRLLSKFGGSGEGFIQIERACREFRKWGIGVMLISQVLSDFVGAIKANINTEIQMRTRDEGDLGRIETKYGTELLQSLVKASVGVGMFVNTVYNNGRPIFVNFRPILHSVRRLSDEELESYNKYNDIIDDLEYQIDQLEEEGIDVFDLRLELKLALDKVKSGNFNMVDIYLEGLTPRIASEWSKLGKKPKKRVVKLVDEELLRSSLQKAKEERAKYEAEHKSEEKKEEKKEDPFRKILKAFTFDNGMMVASLIELKNVIIDTVDDDLLKRHVNDNKNDIAKWVKDNGFTELGDKLMKVKTKDGIVKILEEAQKEMSPKEEKEEGEKKEE